MNINEYYNQVVDFKPNPLQETTWDAFFRNEHPSLLIKASTGTGKTEAVLLPALAAGRRIVMVLPSKALIEDMGQRIAAIGKNYTRTFAEKLAVTVDMGGMCTRFLCQNGQSKRNDYHRHLFVDDIIVTTLDKFIFRLFGYGEKIKSYIFPHRLFGSALGKKPFVIFDEAHDYDGVALSNFNKLVEAFFVKGKDLCVMSATLPENFANFLDVVDATTGKLRERQSLFHENIQGMTNKEKKIFLSESLKAGIVETITEKVREIYSPEKRIIVRTEFVKDVLELYGALKDLLPLVYHGRLVYQKRREVVEQIVKKQSNNEGFLILTTSAIEAGCDIDAHTIVTEICNPDSLVQLAGRLNRRGKMDDSRLIVVGDKVKANTVMLNDERMKQYYRVLASMDGSSFDPEKLRDFFVVPDTDWMGEVLFDMLWDYVYEADLSCKPLWDRGILVTRSWEPSVTLCTGLTSNNIPVNPIQIGMSRLARKFKYDQDKDKRAENLGKIKTSDMFSVTSDGHWHAELKRVYYNNNGGRYDENVISVYPFPTYRLSAYEIHLLCIINEQFVDEYFDPVLGYKKIPTLFLYGFKNGYERTLQYKPEIKHDTFKLNTNKYPEAKSGSVWFLEK